LETGHWTFELRIDKESRFPRVDEVIPRASATASQLCLEPDDARLLVRTLAKLNDRQDEHTAVTLDLGQPPALRVQVDSEGPPAEGALELSSATGKRVRLRVSRRHLLRALQLGFTEIQVVNPETPLVCRDTSKVFVFMPLDPRSAGTPAAASPQASEPVSE